MDFVIAAPPHVHCQPCDLEEIPLDDEDSGQLEFKILEFYVKHHVFSRTPLPALSPKHLRTRSLSQKGAESWPVNEAWTQAMALQKFSVQREGHKPHQEKALLRTLLG